MAAPVRMALAAGLNCFETRILLTLDFPDPVHIRARLIALRQFDLYLCKVSFGRVSDSKTLICVSCAGPCRTHATPLFFVHFLREAIFGLKLYLFRFADFVFQDNLKLWRTSSCVPLSPPTTFIKTPPLSWGAPRVGFKKKILRRRP